MGDLPLWVRLGQLDVRIDVWIRDDICCERAQGFLFELGDGSFLWLSHGDENCELVGLDGQDVGLWLQSWWLGQIIFACYKKSSRIIDSIQHTILAGMQSQRHDSNPCATRRWR